MIGHIPCKGADRTKLALTTLVNYPRWLHGQGCLSPHQACSGLAPGKRVRSEAEVPWEGPEYA